MIRLITGKIGGGKTLFVVNKCLEKFAKGGFVMGNVHFVESGVSEVLERRHKRAYYHEKQFKFHNFEEDLDFYKYLHRGTKEEPTLVVCDEAHLFTPAHNHRKQDEKLEKFNSFLSQSRKMHVDIYFITQDISLLYHRIKAQVEERFHCVDMRTKTYGKLGKPPGVSLKWYKKDMKSDLLMASGSTKLDSKIFGCYDSFQMYDSFMSDLKASTPVFEPIDNRLTKVDVTDVSLSFWNKIWYWNPFNKTQSCA